MISVYRRVFRVTTRGNRTASGCSGTVANRCAAWPAFCQGLSHCLSLHKICEVGHRNFNLSSRWCEEKGGALENMEVDPRDIQHVKNNSWSFGSNGEGYIVVQPFVIRSMKSPIVGL